MRRSQRSQFSIGARNFYASDCKNDMSVNQRGRIASAVLHTVSGYTRRRKYRPDGRVLLLASATTVAGAQNIAKIRL